MANPFSPLNSGKAETEITQDASKMPQFGGVDGYYDLERVLTLAYDQSARGKGKERHAKSRPFESQPIRTIPEMLGAREGLGGLAYQVIKKVQESVGMTNRHRTTAAKAELLGAIVYAAAAYLHIEGVERANPEDYE